MANFYRDIFINKGDDFSEVIEISIPFDEYEFSGTVRSSIASLVGIPITCEAVDGQTHKMRISIPSELTATLSRRRGVYSILATNILTEEQVTERQGTAHYSQAPTFVPAQPPPPNYVVQLENVEGAGTAAAADVEDFATAEQGDLADTALQAASVSGATQVLDLTGKEFLLKGTPIDSVTWDKLKELLQVYFDEFYGESVLPMTVAQLSVLAADAEKPRLIYTTDTGDLYTLGINEVGSQAKPMQVKYSYRHEFTSNVNYLGKAIFGALEADEVWTVTRLTITSDGTTTSDVALTPIAWTDRANPTNYTP